MISRFLKGLMGQGKEPEETALIYVMLPIPLEPDARETQFGVPLDAELRLAAIGYVSGGGTLQSAPDENGDCDIIHCGVDVDAVDIDAARELLRLHLPELGCPSGTALMYDAQGIALQDEYDGERWHLAQPQPEYED